MVEFHVNRRVFGACNDRLKRGLGAKPGFREMFVIISERERTCLQLLGIAGLN